MSEVDDIDLDVVLRRIDELMKEVRRQGRASIAAQAAAESCLESVSTLQEQMRESAAAQDPPDNDDREAVVRALLPFVDALDRTAEHARALAESTPRPSALARWLGVPDTSPGLASMRDGTRLLRGQ
ncbi:MAG: hypothetical protein MUF54_13580, partial [Polyangiaceae bacterium]|nr:hypothetical protein [Polyangiaceae bacterium]